MTHTASTEEVAGRTGLPPLVRALLHPDAYSHPAENLRLHETHSSWVILAGPYAYKLRKPVDLGFLDFTTPERRRTDCEEEVRLNRRLCPDVYLGVVGVIKQGGRYRVNANVQTGEPAVWMRRLPEEGMLPELLARGTADARLVGRIGQRLARFHADAGTGPGVNEYGSLATIGGNWQENLAQMAQFEGRTVSTHVNTDIRTDVESFLAEHVPLLERRVDDGRVRDGHGDLHAASICVERGRLQLFDCLQFAPRFRCADVASEVAFLNMDLEHYGRADLAWAFVEAYARASGDTELKQLLDFYSCYRAYVRGKVRSLRLAQPGLAPATEAREAANARAYFDLAWAHAGGLASPTLLVSMGLPASGKTTLARALASRLGLVHLSSDVVRKFLVGLGPTERRMEAFQQGLYDPAMTRRTYAALHRRAATWLRHGRSVVLDATYGDPDERAAVRRVAQRSGVRLVVLLCWADDLTLRARLSARAREEAVASDARLELWPDLRGAFVEPAEIPEVVRVDTALAPTESVEHALAILRGTPSTSAA